MAVPGLRLADGKSSASTTTRPVPQEESSHSSTEVHLVSAEGWLTQHCRGNRRKQAPAGVLGVSPLAPSPRRPSHPHSCAPDVQAENRRPPPALQ